MIWNIVFSPTGGSRKVADIISSALSEDVNVVDLTERDIPTPQISQDDICVITVPAYAGRVPALATSRIKQITSNGAKAIIIATFGNRAIDDTLIELYDITTEMEFDVVAAIEAITEHSIIREFGKGRPNEDDRKELMSFAETIKKRIKDGKIYLNIPGNRPYKPLPGKGMVPFGDTKCIECNRCVNHCPVEAIDISTPRETDSDRCISCMRCVSICPQNSRHVPKDKLEALKARIEKACTERKTNKLY